jgi:hypothetical protein
MDIYIYVINTITLPSNKGSNRRRNWRLFTFMLPRYDLWDPIKTFPSLSPPLSLSLPLCLSQTVLEVHFLYEQARLTDLHESSQTRLYHFMISEGQSLARERERERKKERETTSSLTLLMGDGGLFP